MPAWTAADLPPMTGRTVVVTGAGLEIVLFSLELQRRLDAAGSPVRSVLAHPGIATTTLAAHSPSGRINSLRFLLNDPEHGALPTLFAVSQDVPGNAYIGPDGFGSIRGYPTIRQPGKAGLDVTAAQQRQQPLPDRLTRSS
jgi:hypothetical protein